MKKLLNVLYVLTENCYLSKEGDCILVSKPDGTKARFPAHIIESISCHCTTAVSTPFLGFCAEKGISVSFFSYSGRFFARTSGPSHGNVLLRVAQYDAMRDEHHALSLARNFVLGKLANSRLIILRAAREAGAGQREELDSVAERLAAVARDVSKAQSVESIRGLEGAAAQAYFSVFDRMIKPESPLRFGIRTRRPPQDAVNAMLSFAYTLLVSDARSALEGVGLDACVGYLHALRPGRPALALDLIEELRAPLCDRFVLSLLNLRTAKEAGFVSGPTSVIMTDAMRKTFLDAWQQRKRETIVHPFLGEKIEIGLILHIQAQLLAKHLRSEIAEYPPFLWR